MGVARTGSQNRAGNGLTATFINYVPYSADRIMMMMTCAMIINAKNVS